MPRPALHLEDGVLDAVRDLVVETGPRAVGIRAIAERSGAPSGSLYHRFGSRDELLARAWLRAVKRYQAGVLRALDEPDPREAVARGASWAAMFATDEPADARLLLGHSRRALLDGEPSTPTAEALERVNEPLERAVRALARRLYGTESGDAVERVSYAVIDLPYAVVRRHLLAGSLSRVTAKRLEHAARALVKGGRP